MTSAPATAPNAVIATTPRVSVSSWALHPLLGRTHPGRPGDPDAYMIAPAAGDGTTYLLDVPAKLAAMGIRTMEVCHFHLPANEPGYYEDFRQALDEAGVELWSLLIDDGDLTHPEHGARDAAWVQGWLDVAGILGARCARVIAGKQQPTPENIEAARVRLLDLALAAYVRGVRLLTENWFALLSRPEHVHALLSGTNRMVGLTFDFGNWGGPEKPEKYEMLTGIASLAEGCHAKCNFAETGEADWDDFARCCDLLRGASYAGPFTLVASNPRDIWAGIAEQRDFLRLRGYALAELRDTPPPA
jgi:hypothetical protein